MTLTRALGLMSGTSMDGVDAALIETDGERRVAFGPFASFAYSEGDRALLRAALAEAAALTDRAARPGVLAEAERLVTERHAEAVAAFLAAHSIRPGSLDVIGFHGQTVLHRAAPTGRHSPHAEERPQGASRSKGREAPSGPSFETPAAQAPQDEGEHESGVGGLTVQIGDGAALARACGVDVVFDMRAADVAAGGQGAPLVPVYHQALARAAGLPGHVVVANIGGVANITSLAPGRDPLAGDTGPGNALLDDLMLERTSAAIDRDGACAARGRIDETALATLTAHPFFAAPLPKSLDRNAFSRAGVAGLATEDAAATLTAFTAETLARAVRDLPTPADLVVVCGGGARNPTLMRMLAARLACRVATAEEFGWSAEAMEAQAFAYLAVRSLKGLPLTFPTTTGVARPLTGGALARK